MLKYINSQLFIALLVFSVACGSEKSADESTNTDQQNNGNNSGLNQNPSNQPGTQNNGVNNGNPANNNTQNPGNNNPNQPKSPAKPNTGNTNVPQGNAVKLTINYAGAKDGSLVIGLFKFFPGPPSAFKTIDKPQFPQEIVIQAKPGKYTLVTSLDVGRNNPTMPGNEDLQTKTNGVQVTESKTPEVKITLNDK